MSKAINEEIENITKEEDVNLIYSKVIDIIHSVAEKTIGKRKVKNNEVIKKFVPFSTEIRENKRMYNR